MKNNYDIPSIEPLRGACANSSCKKILIVEDEMITTLAESQVVKCCGYEVAAAGSGEEAVDIIRGDPSIDLVLMDIDLGTGIDGTEAARQILSMRNVPIVFLTSYSERELVEKVRRITRYGYVLKNSGDFVLLSSIERAFELFNAHERTEKHRQAEEAVLLLKKRNEFILASAGEGIYGLDREGRAFYFNPTAAWS